MTPLDVLSAGTALFIVGMVWLRTRMHYPRGSARGPLTRTGRIYFAALAAVLALGWLAAPAAGRAIGAAVATPALARVVWFLATYYAFIPVHRVMQAQGARVFRQAAADLQANDKRA
jgi:hypothetical protein